MALVITKLSTNALRTHEATPLPPPKPGQPRLNGPEAFLHEFYEELVILEVLQRCLGIIKQPSRPATTTTQRFQHWQVFLDQLSWLTDSDNGGNTTSSIAVEATSNGPKYLLAVNYDSEEKCFRQLKRVLATLAAAKLSTVEACRRCHSELLKECLSFSQKKFKNYQYELSKSIHYAGKSKPEEGSAGQCVIFFWRSLIRHGELFILTLLLEKRFREDVKSSLELKEPFELCIFAFDYAKSDLYKEMLLKHRDKSPEESGSAWSNICHWIGRFQSWVRAIKVLICYVKEHPQDIKNFQTGFVKHPEDLESLVRPDADQKTHLRGVLERMLPKDKDRAEKAFKILQDHPKPIREKIDLVFKDLYGDGDKSFTPRCHAELMILEYFWVKKLPFFHDIRYVGSSKPSCYCCDLYFRSHPSDITTRATHGNVWPKWCLPPGLKQRNSERLQWDYKNMLKRMTEEIESDVLTSIESDLPRRKRVQDSTTGIWTAPTFAYV